MADLEWVAKELEGLRGGIKEFEWQLQHFEKNGELP